MAASRPHPVPRRDLHFDLSGIDLNRWHSAGYRVSHYFNVESLLFPQGERFFIRSVRHFRDQVSDPVLQEQVAGFIAQEAMHGREHEAYNAALAKIGYRVDLMDRLLARSFEITEKWLSPKFKLAMTAALEHITAIGAKGALQDPRVLGDIDSEMRRLWLWHAMEETEHKAVAFDVYREVAGNGLGAWLRRCAALLMVSISMQSTIWIALARVPGRGGLWSSLREWGRLINFMWGRPGVFRREIPDYFRFFSPAFHPWDIDNYHRVQDIQSAYAAASREPAASTR